MWALDPSVIHLNHGSFGATPVAVLRDQEEWRSRMEANPTLFVNGQLGPAIHAAREMLARFVGADPRGVAFTRNASTGVASVLRSIEPSLLPGDEIITTTHDYNAVRQMLQFLAGRSGARVVLADFPFPIDGPEVVERAVLDRVGKRTRLVVIDQVTSPTGLLLPVESLVERLEPEIPVLVDGAHGPGQVQLDLDRLGASWYTGNLHKWTCAAKGTAFLYARPDRREMTVPTVISHGWNAEIPPGEDRYQLLFDWLGTDDFSGWLSAPAALAAVEEAGGSWSQVIERNHRLIVEARGLICARLGIEEPAPEYMVGSMASVPLPDLVGEPVSGDLSPLMGRLAARGLEVLALIWPSWPRQLLRISAHLYNRIEDYEALADALDDEL